MTAKTAGQKPTPIPGPRSAHAYEALVLAGEVIYNGALVQKDPATGKWVEATSTGTGIVHGWARLGDVDSFDGTAAALLSPVPEMLVDSGCNLVIFGSITQADEGKIAYVVDDQTMTITPGGPVGGVVQLYSDATHAYVAVDPLVNKALSLTSAGGAQANRTARMVSAASVPIYTGSKTATLTVTATGALSSMDGVTPAVNDVVFFQEGSTNLTDPADAGPWVVSVAGTTGISPVFVRPSWWAHGAPIVPGIVIEIGGEGTGTDPTLAGTEWKTFCGKGKIIGTDAPVFWPRSISSSVTLASGTLAAARRTIPVRGTAGLITAFSISSNPATAPHASTRLWRVSALTVGLANTSSVQIVAESAPGTTNSSDVGQYNLVATLW